MTWPEAFGWTLQSVLWASLVGRYATPRMIAYMTASYYPPEDDE